MDRRRKQHGLATGWIHETEPEVGDSLHGPRDRGSEPDGDQHSTVLGPHWRAEAHVPVMSNVLMRRTLPPAAGIRAIRDPSTNWSVGSQVAVGQVAGRVGARGLVDGLDLDLDGAPAAPASFVEAAVHEESVEPGIEPVRVTKPGQVPPGSNEGVLDRVARELRVPQDESRGRVQPG